MNQQKKTSDLIDMAMIMPQYPIPNYKDGGDTHKEKEQGEIQCPEEENR